MTTLREIIPSIKDTQANFCKKFITLFRYLTGKQLNFIGPSRNPHEITGWHQTKQGVYVFLASSANCEYCLKVGKAAGPKSGPRWTSHHYTLNGDEDAKNLSTLPRSIEKDNKTFLRIYEAIGQINEAKDFIVRLTKIRQNIKESKKNGDTYDPEGIIRKWIEANTTRMEFIIPDDVTGPHLVNMLEGYLQWLLKPCYEGG